jgi:hypothetical protein
MASRSDASRLEYADPFHSRGIPLTHNPSHGSSLAHIAVPHLNRSAKQRPPSGGHWAEHDLDELLRRQVRALLERRTAPVLTERRGAPRYLFPRLLVVTPVAADGETVLAQSLCAVGKHLSEHGLGFYHAEPLFQRLVVVSVELEPEKWVGFLVDVHRCCFTTYGWYESGGRLVRPVRPIAPRAVPGERGSHRAGDKGVQAPIQAGSSEYRPTAALNPGEGAVQTAHTW